MLRSCTWRDWERFRILDRVIRERAPLEWLTVWLRCKSERLCCVLLLLLILLLLLWRLCKWEWLVLLLVLLLLCDKVVIPCCAGSECTSRRTRRVRVCATRLWLLLLALFILFFDLTGVVIFCTNKSAAIPTLTHATKASLFLSIYYYIFIIVVSFINNNFYFGQWQIIFCIATTICKRYNLKVF